MPGGRATEAPNVPTLERPPPLAAVTPPQAAAHAPEAGITAGQLFFHLLWAVAWGAAQWWAVGQIAATVGWARLPYHTVEEVGVWFFLAINASAWGILTYSGFRFRRPILWFWWGACATWWVMFFLPYHEARAAFSDRLRASEVTGLQLAGRIRGYQRERGRLPGKLQDVAERDGQPIPVTSFETHFDYRLLDLNHFELAVPVGESGDKTFCYLSREPKAGFRLGYFRP
jgi:hypothetical protein